MSLNIAKLEGKIHGVDFRQCSTYPDSRGSFTEVFRSEWPPSASYSDQIQMNLSRSHSGSMRGLHFHHRQSDWWIPVSGSMQVVMADLRTGSPTFMVTQSVELRSCDSVCLLIPPGVAHGFLALEDICLIYAVNRYYDGADEQGVAWNDSDLQINWKIEDPVRSDRDRSNPSVKELSEKGLLPVFCREKS